MHLTLNPDQMYATVDILILTENNGSLGLLLSKRKTAPFQDCWALPGCFVDTNESADETVEKLLKEMLPVSKAYREQLYTFSAVNRDVRGRVISVAYLVIVPWKTLVPILESQSTSFICFTLTGDNNRIHLHDSNNIELEPCKLAFDHEQIILTGLNRIKGKIEYSDIAFHFLKNPNAFSLSELQKIFEAVLDKPMDASNFRRFILNRYEESGKLVQTELAEKKKRGRPAALYRWLG